MDIHWLDADKGGPYDALDAALQVHSVRKIWVVVPSEEDVAAAARELDARDYTVAVGHDAAAFLAGYAKVLVCSKDTFQAHPQAFAPLATRRDAQGGLLCNVLVLADLTDHAASGCLQWWHRQTAGQHGAVLRVLWM